MSDEAASGEPLVTVLLVTYNSAGDLDRCLSAVQRQKVVGGHELVVVDNASSDGSADLIEAWADSARADLDVTVVRNSANTGYAAANNQAAALARGRLLLLLNPDAVMDDGCLQSLVEHLMANPGVGAASALLRNPDGTPQAFARREVTLGSVFWDLTELGRRIDLRWRNARGRRQRRYEDEFARLDAAPLVVDSPAAACVAIWRELTAPQLFDEQFPLFFNDAELFARLHLRCYRCEIVPAATAVHGYGTSHRQVDHGRKRAEFVTSMRRYVAVRFGLRRSAALNALLLLDVLVCLSIGLRRRQRRLRRVARGTLGGLGLPGGLSPWLTRRLPVRRRLIALRTRVGDSLRATVAGIDRRRRRRRVIRRINLQSWLLRAPVDVHIDPTADVSGDLRVELRARRRSRIVIDAHAVVNDGVLLRLWGGELHIGGGALVRHGAVLIAKGRLEIAPRAVISRDSQLHADGTMRIGFGAGVAERVSIVDTDHQFDDVPAAIFDKPVHQADVTIEPLAFIGTNSVVTSGVTVGRSAVVAAMSVVTRDVPAATVVAGVPARAVRSIDRVLGEPPVAHDDSVMTPPSRPSREPRDRLVATTAAPGRARRPRRSSPADPS